MNQHTNEETKELLTKLDGLCKRLTSTANAFDNGKVNDYLPKEDKAQRKGYANGLRVAVLEIETVIKVSY